MKEIQILFLLIFMPSAILAQQNNPSFAKPDTSYVRFEVFHSYVSNYRAKLDSLYEIISSVKETNANLNVLLQRHKDQIETLKSRLDEQEKALVQSIHKLDSIRKKLANKIKLVNKEIAGLETETESQFAAVTSNLSKSRWWIGIAFMFVLLIGIIGFIFVKNRSSKEKEKLDDRFTEKNNELNEKVADLEQTNKSDTKLLEVLSDKLENIPLSNGQQEVDHSLALASSLEIMRMRKRIERMDADAKGLKSLIKALERLEDELKIKGYEIVDLEGEDYDERMDLKADFIPDDHLAEDEAVITRTIKPQINYQGKAIQHAHVQVNTGTIK